MKRLERLAAARGGVLLLVAFASTVVGAEERPEAPPPQAQRLKALAGSWKITGEMTMGDRASKVTGEAKCHEAASGWAVTCTMKLKGVLDVKEYTEVGIFTYDPDSQSTHYYSAANTGDAHDHVGNWTEPSTLQLQTSSRVEGKPAQEVIQIVQKGPKELEVHNPVTSAGKEISLTHFTMKK